MRTIGSIERILVVGIVLVIGTILIVAIKGAGDFDEAQREKQAQLAASGRGAAKKDASAKSAERPTAPKPLNKAVRPPPSDGSGTEAPKVDAPAVLDARGTAEPESGGANPHVDELIQKQLDALNGKTGGEKKPIAGGADQAGGDGLADKGDPESAPVVVEDDLGIPHEVDPKDLPPPANEAKEYIYTVQGGDSLERIARAVYGDGTEWRAIAASNPSVGDGQLIRAGDKLKLPKPPTQGLDLVVTTTGSGTGPKSDAAKPGPAKSPELSTPPVNGGSSKGSGFKRTGTATEHTVAKGDTLMSIALDHYGTKAAWKLIYDANADRIPDKDRIKVGVVLRLPAQ